MKNREIVMIAYFSKLKKGCRSEAIIINAIINFFNKLKFENIVELKI